jgi:hypothetical protein
MHMMPKGRPNKQPPGPAGPQKNPKKAPHSNVCPAFFRAMVQDARTGEKSFADCGHELGRQIFTIVGEELGEEALGELVMTVLKRDPAAILEWLKTRVPKMMALIPPRQYPQFMKGFMRAVEEGLVQPDLPVAA